MHKCTSLSEHPGLRRETQKTTIASKCESRGKEGNEEERIGSLRRSQFSHEESFYPSESPLTTREREKKATRKNQGEIRTASGRTAGLGEGNRTEELMGEREPRWDWTRGYWPGGGGKEKNTALHQGFHEVP